MSTPLAEDQMKILGSRLVIETLYVCLKMNTSVVPLKGRPSGRGKSGDQKRGVGNAYARGLKRNRELWNGSCDIQWNHRAGAAVEAFDQKNYVLP